MAGNATVKGRQALFSLWRKNSFLRDSFLRTMVLAEPQQCGAFSWKKRRRLQTLQLFLSSRKGYQDFTFPAEGMTKPRLGDCASGVFNLAQVFLVHCHGQLEPDWAPEGL